MRVEDFDIPAVGDRYIFINFIVGVNNRGDKCVIAESLPVENIFE